MENDQKIVCNEKSRITSETPSNIKFQKTFPGFLNCKSNYFCLMSFFGLAFISFSYSKIRSVTSRKGMFGSIIIIIRVAIPQHPCFAIEAGIGNSIRLTLTLYFSQQFWKQCKVDYTLWPNGYAA